MPSELEHDLRVALRGDDVAVDPARRDALEDELVTRLEGRAVPPQRRRWPRIALGVGLGSALAIAACALPVDYAAELGHRLAIVVDADAEIDPHAIAAFVTDHYQPDELRMAVSQERMVEHTDAGDVIERGELRIEIDAVGEDIDTDAMWDDLVEAFPALDGGRLEDEALRTTVHGTLGGRLSHAWLDVVIDRHGIEAAKAQILLELDAQGIGGDAHIEIVDDHDDAGNRRREVRVRVEDGR